MSVVPLRRNRDFVLLETGRLLSTSGTAASVIAYPLLVLALTHSAAKTGVVSFARLVPQALFALFAGVAADRWNRKWLMIGADAVRAAAVGTLGALILLDGVSFWQIPAVAFVEGVGSTFFSAAQAGALRAVVPAQQLPAAVAAQGARQSTVQVAGPPLGGVLFGLGRAVPFVADAVSYSASIVSLLAMRTPFQERRERDTARLRTQIAEGVRFVWAQPFVRTTSFLYAIGNFTIPAVLLVLVVTAKRQGLSPGAIGLLLALFGACTLLGSIVSGIVRRALSMRAIVLLELWLGLATLAFVVRPSVYVLTAAVMLHGVSLPITDSVVNGYRVAITPDRLVGRVESVRSNIALLVMPLGPLAAGFLLDSVSARATIAVLAACSLALAVWGTLTPSIRDAPSLAELV